MVKVTTEYMGQLPQMGQRPNLLLPHPKLRIYPWPVEDSHMPNALGLNVFVPQWGLTAPKIDEELNRALARFYAVKSVSLNDLEPGLLNKMRTLESQPTEGTADNEAKQGVNILYIDADGLLQLSGVVRYAKGHYCDLSSVYCQWALFCYLESTFTAWAEVIHGKITEDLLESMFGLDVAFMLNSMRMAGIAETFAHWFNGYKLVMRYTEYGGMHSVQWTLDLETLKLSIRRTCLTTDLDDDHSLLPVMFRLFPTLLDFKFCSTMTRGEMMGTANRRKKDHP